MTNKLQYISYLILISIFINQGDGRWKERDKEELKKDFMAYKKFKEKLKNHIEKFYQDNPKELLFDYDDSPYIKDFEPDVIKLALTEPKNDTVKLKINSFNKVTHFNPYIDGFKSINENIDELPKKSSKSEPPTEHSRRYPPWPKFEDLLRSSGKKYDWKNDRWIKVKKKEQLVTVNEDENAIHNYVKHEFKYKVLKAKNKKRKNVVVVTAVR